MSITDRRSAQRATWGIKLASALVLYGIYLLLVFYPSNSTEPVIVYSDAQSDSLTTAPTVIESDLDTTTKPLILICENNISDTVQATCYNPTVGQTDDSPDRTATGFQIDVLNPYKHRVIAVSKDLEDAGFGMGDSVSLEFAHGSKAEIYNGHYIIEDRMPRQHTATIDLLMSSDMYMSRFKGVVITKLQ